jgi:Na+-driven multidrug efflux pump
MGVAGAGAALICFNLGSMLVLAWYMRSPKSAVRLAPARLEWRLFKDVLKVGLLSAIGTVLANLTVVVTTGLTGAYGRDAIAGYGLAARLDYILIPLLFALGTASVTMVGTNVGAGQPARARSIAWTGALISTLATGAIGLAVALFPQAWIHLFSADPRVVAAGSAYLARVGPFYALFGAGMSVYFASQGAGRMAWPFAAGVVRLLTVMLLGGYWINALGGSLNGLYWIVAAAYFLFGGINLFALASGSGWGAGKAAVPARAGA